MTTSIYELLARVSFPTEGEGRNFEISIKGKPDTKIEHFIAYPRNKAMKHHLEDMGMDWDYLATGAYYRIEYDGQTFIIKPKKK